MKSAKDKAKELTEKMAIHHWTEIVPYVCNYESAKQCTLIAVDEIITTLNYDIKDLDVRGNVLLKLINYWRDVKTEIEKLL